MADYSAGFERFWKLYPSSRRKGKIKCFGYWQKRNLEDRADAIIEKLEADLAHDEQWAKGFIPLSSTYLNEGRYDDDKPRPKRAHAPQAKADDREVLEVPWYNRSANLEMLRFWASGKSFSEDQLREIWKIKQRLVKDQAHYLEDEPNRSKEFGKAFASEVKRIIAVPGV